MNFEQLSAEERINGLLDGITEELELVLNSDKSPVVKEAYLKNALRYSKMCKDIIKEQSKPKESVQLCLDL